ncbi:MAG: hypothetical protein SNJ59_02325 [Aggregatilineales bacterium]
MIRRLTGGLPDWAQPNHPILRHALGINQPRPRWQVRYGRALAFVLIGASLLLIGYLTATNFLRRAPGENPVEAINNTLFIPLLVAQLLLRAFAVLLTSSIVADQIHRQNWDSLRATPSGAELTLRARWALVFYRLRGLLGTVIAVRIGLLLLMLYDLTAFQGRYLDLLISGITPDVSLVIAVLLLALMMTAALLLPFTAVGFDASIGLLIAAQVRGRTLNTVLQVLYILLRVGLTVALLVLLFNFLRGGLFISGALAWLLIAAAAAVGDWGLSLLYLSRYGEIWAIVPYGILIGLALLVFALAQAAIVDQLLLVAVRRAQRNDS